MPRLYALLLLAGCSDYDLGKATDEPHDRPPRDTDTPDTDTTRDTDTTAPDDSGSTTIPGDDSGGTPEDVPEGRIDVALLIDIAYVYDCYHADLSLHTSDLAAALIGSGADVAVAVATYDDYQVSGEWWAASGGVPYLLEQQMTTDLTRIQSAAATLSLEWGGDGPGTGLEALVQATEGDGYDQNCDGRFDATTDIRPFNARSSDVFGGAVTGSAVTSTTGTGTRAGVGWRDGSKRVVVVLAENAFRDRSEGHDFPTGSCSATATRTAAISAIMGVDAKFLGVNAYEFQDIDPVLQEQLEDIARQTNSKIDRDNDGAVDDLAVLYGDWDWPATGVLKQAIWDLAR